MSPPAASARAIAPGEAIAIASQLVQAGDFRTAAQIFGRLWHDDPRNAQLAYRLAVCEHHLGLFDQASAHFQAAIDREPAQPQYHLALGRNYKQQERYPEAIASYRKALDLAPQSVDTLVSLGIALWRDEQAEEAVTVFGAALQLAPDSYEATVNCGNALLRLERQDEAIDMYRRALALRPDSADVHNNLGRALVVVGEPAEARQCFDQALQLVPDHPEALFNTGDLLFFSGQSLEAETYYSRAVASRPRYADGYIALGRARFDAGQFASALACFDKMAEVAPQSAAAQNWRGIVLRHVHRTAEALQAFEQAARLAKDPADGYAEIGITYWQLGEARKAEEFADLALRADATHPPAFNLKGNIALTSGRANDAIAWFSKAVDADPAFPMFGENVLFAMNYAEGVDAVASFAAHRDWGDRQPRPAVKKMRRQTVLPGGRLRLGFVSPDFISHSVAHFITPVFRHIDRDRFDIFAYSNNRRSDAVTESLRQLATGWRSIAGRNDEIAADMIRRDGIDILIDLAGHTAENRLGVFLREPAPMQVTYLGYPTTTGLPTMQYRLSDGIVDPEGAEHFSTETLLRLPYSYFCYMPPAEAPPVSDLPSASRRVVTFGSFNNLAKLTGRMFRLWAGVLDAVPDSRLVLKTKSLNDADVRAEIEGRLAQAGIDSHRVELRGFELDRKQHLTLYGDIDIALDTFPFNGATTTCEALWMGVPVVTLPGQTHASRMGASILSAAGLREWIAADEDGYVGICAQIAHDLRLLAQTRAGLRAAMTASHLMDYAGFMREFETLLRAQFERLGHA
jgi:protein O-GlcNAc transferase